MNFEILDKVIVLSSMRESGKSYMVKWILESNKHLFKKIYIICPTNSINHFYDDITSQDCIHDDFDEEWFAG